MGLVAKEVREMSQQDILRFEEAEKVTIAGHTLELTDIKVSSSHPMLFSFNEEYAVTLFLLCVVQIVRVFKRSDGLKDTEIDANGDGTGLVTLSISFVYIFDLITGARSTVKDITFALVNDEGDVLVLLDLRPYDSLYEAGVAREVK